MLGDHTISLTCKCSARPFVQLFDIFDALSGTFSVNGWSTSQCMMYYLEHVILEDSKGEPCVLIWDCYSAHKTAEVKQSRTCAQRHLDVRLLVIDVVYCS
jgi:hypothetical protein